MSAKWFVIINPTSGNGKAKKLWPKIKKLLDRYNFDFEFAFTENASHNVDLVHVSVNQGVKNIICVGGDGTIHNTVNGIMTQDRFASNEITLGVIPIGTGNDWVRTHEIPKDLEKAFVVIKQGQTAVQDVGKIEFLKSDKSPVFFNNLAGIGFDGYVASKVGRYKHLGGIAYLLGAILGLFSFKNFDVALTTNDDHITTKALMALIGLCQYSGGGMQLTKYSHYNNGKFDISLAKNFSKVDIVINTPKLYNGTITKLNKVVTLNNSEIEVKILGDKKPLIQADGEIVGSGSFKVSLVSNALKFCAS